MLVKSNSREETLALGEKIGLLLKPKMLLCLNGDLAAGKTTFTQGLAKGLGVKEIVNSPTFNILKIYEGRLRLYHIDAYRLKDNPYDLGFEEYFYDDEAVVVIEWSDFLVDILPNDYLLVNISNLGEDQRAFEFLAYGKRYQEFIKEIISC